jgi:outer membrane receptor protein involved in Fe transport
MTRANAYALRYRLDLFSNFTYFLDDPVNGDQFQQSDRRTVLGGRASHRFVSRLGGRASELLVGADLRHDRIGQVGLFRTAARQVLDAVRDDQVNQTSLAAYAQHELQWTPWLRSNLGLRADTFRFDVTALQPANSGDETDTLVSPKASLVIGPWRQSEFYVNAGYGYHSNDARGTTIAVDPVSGEAAERVTPLARARGSEVGFRTVPVRGLQTSLALWRLGLDSELIFIGDAGTTEASRPSRRYGVEWDTYFSPRPWLTIDADLAWSRSRFSDDDPAGALIPGSVERVASAGLTLDDGRLMFGSVRLRYFGARNLVEDGSVRSTPTRLLNGQGGVRLTPKVRLVLDAFNLLNAEASDIEYFYGSRLSGEPEDGVDDIHLHPTLPRTVRLGVQFRF